MKRNILILALAAAAALSAGARDRLYIDNFTLNANEQKQVAVNLANDTVYCALQTDLVLPAGISLVENGGYFDVYKTGRLTNNHLVTCNRLSSGAIRIMVTTDNGRAISGTSGAVLQLTLKGDVSLSGRYAVKLTNSIVVEADGAAKHRLASTTAYVNDSGNAADVNGDGVVDVADLNHAINGQLGRETIPKADVNGDGVIDVADLNAIINTMLAAG